MEPKVFLKPGPFKQIFPYNTVISLYSCPLKIMHNITLQMFTGNYGDLAGKICNIYLERAVRITEKPYTPQRERLRILW